MYLFPASNTSLLQLLRILVLYWKLLFLSLFSLIHLIALNVSNRICAQVSSFSWEGKQQRKSVLKKTMIVTCVWKVEGWVWFQILSVAMKHMQYVIVLIILVWPHFYVVVFSLISPGELIHKIAKSHFFSSSTCGWCLCSFLLLVVNSESWFL